MGGGEPAASLPRGQRRRVCGAPQSLTSPTSGKVLVLPGGLTKSGGCLENRRPVEYTKRSVGQRGQGAKVDSSPGGSPAISAKRKPWWMGGFGSGRDSGSSTVTLEEWG